jgi:hypothetical protein
MLTIRDNANGTFAVIDTLVGVRIVRDGFSTRDQAQQFLEDFYLGRTVAEHRAKKH